MYIIKQNPLWIALNSGDSFSYLYVKIFKINYN